MNEKFSHGCSSFLALGPALSVTGRLIFLVAQDGKEQERLAKEGKKKKPQFLRCKRLVVWSSPESTRRSQLYKARDDLLQVYTIGGFDWDELKSWTALLLVSLAFSGGNLDGKKFSDASDNNGSAQRAPIGARRPSICDEHRQFVLRGVIDWGFVERLYHLHTAISWWIIQFTSITYTLVLSFHKRAKRTKFPCGLDQPSIWFLCGDGMQMPGL